jgi:hypothetical protein
MPTSVSGATELRLALKKFTPELSKLTQQEMANALKPIVKKARGYLPANSQMLSGWTSATSSADTINYREFPKYDQTEAKRGVKYSTTPSKPNKRGFVALARVMNKSAGGAIYETAGRKNPQGQPTFQRTKFTPASYREDGHGYNKSLNPNAGKQFIERANATGELRNARPKGMVGRSTRKLTGRVIFRAFEEDQGRATGAVIKALEKAGISFNKTAKAKNG